MMNSMRNWEEREREIKNNCMLYWPPMVREINGMLKQTAADWAAGQSVVRLNAHVPLKDAATCIDILQAIS